MKKYAEEVCKTCGNPKSSCQCKRDHGGSDSPIEPK